MQFWSRWAAHVGSGRPGWLRRVPAGRWGRPRPRTPVAQPLRVEKRQAPCVCSSPICPSIERYRFAECRRGSGEDLHAPCSESGTNSYVKTNRTSISGENPWPARPHCGVVGASRSPGEKWPSLQLPGSPEGPSRLQPRARLLGPQASVQGHRPPRPSPWTLSCSGLGSCSQASVQQTPRSHAPTCFFFFFYAAKIYRT